MLDLLTKFVDLLIQTKKDKERQLYASPVFSFKVGRPEKDVVHITVKNKGVSAMSNVVIWGRNVGAIFPNAETLAIFRLLPDSEVSLTSITFSFIEENGKVNEYKIKKNSWELERL